MSRCWCSLNAVPPLPWCRCERALRWRSRATPVASPGVIGTKPTCGRVVHYVLPCGPNMGQHRAAWVCEPRDPPQTFNDHSKDWSIDLHVALRPDDVPRLGDPPIGIGDDVLRFVASVPPDNSGIGNPLPGTWHWPEREPQ